MGDTSAAGPGVRVRQATSADWAALRRTRLAALADSPDAFASTLARESRLTEADWRDWASTAAWFLAWPDRGNPVGLVATRPSPDAAPASAAPWMLLSMWVAPAARGSGAAGLLVAAGAGHARAAGADRLTLWVAAGNARARAFYLRMGFAPTGARQSFQREGGPAFDEEEMALDPRAAR